MLIILIRWLVWYGTFMLCHLFVMLYICYALCLLCSIFAMLIILLCYLFDMCLICYVICLLCCVFVMPCVCYARYLLWYIFDMCHICYACWCIFWYALFLLCCETLWYALVNLFVIQLVDVFSGMLVLFMVWSYLMLFLYSIPHFSSCYMNVIYMYTNLKSKLMGNFDGVLLQIYTENAQQIEHTHI